jgi:hypothetical protein
MITAERIQNVLPLTGVTLIGKGSTVWITANEPVTDEMQAKVRAWWEAGEVNAIPWAISNADLRRQLVLRGINPALVLAYLNSLDEGPQKWGAVADWEYANYFERSHPMLNQLAPSFGLSVEDVDEMFLACPAYPRML